MVSILQDGDVIERITCHEQQLGLSNDIVVKAPNLGWIQSLTTGTDAILSLPALRQTSR